ncbi:NUMOD4 motif-containing HNH endonuclease [Pseudoglutamicibacter cumminsii]|uniref:NUMOD4 motif-containing HNH endonuclease n=1 Tax=Pseudoglutamicibacter cumminsii TaxID=156979 RepID=UPI0019561AA3|nr:NUMOD4 motif-containing HNH endonuclease [Pseudoglutamicibacter cumminsii]MBM7795817.1 hypothetical protein [Pseudoglutamicibacter cumminsii]MBM7796863.1 hypothetical protein [Pseudoglutamicibacter cumminsii]
MTKQRDRACRYVEPPNAKTQRYDTHKQAYIYATQCATTVEEWRPIPGYEPRYLVSNHGRLKNTETGRYVGTREHGGTGYIRATIYKQGATKPTRARVHVLVAAAFLGPRPAGLDICHTDSNPGNNHIGNLRYDTRGANIADAKHAQTRCANGHPWNTQTRYVRADGGGWKCRICRNEGIARYRARTAGHITKGRRSWASRHAAAGTGPYTATYTTNSTEPRRVSDALRRGGNTRHAPNRTGG